MRSILSILLCYCLFLSQVFAQVDLSGLQEGGANFSQELEDLAESEKEELKNLNISQGLQDSVSSSASNIKPSLTNDDRKALKLLGYSDQEIDDLSLGTFTDGDGGETLKNRAKAYAENKKSEVEKEAMGTLVPGLASSVIGLAFASMMGLVVGVRCHNQPSALTFAGTAAAWVGLEIMIWKGYQVRMKDIETLQEAQEIPNVISSKVDRAKKIISDLESRYKANPSGNFEAFLEKHKPQVQKLEEIAKSLRDFLKVAKDRQFGALRSIHESIELAAETSRKKARNATVAATGFAAAAGLAAAEHYNVFNNAGTCSTGKMGSLPWPLSLIPSAHAGFATVGDFDKIGIPIGAGLGSAYLGFKQKFADKIYNSAVSRAVVFVAMAGIATLAAVKLNQAAKFLEKQADEMEVFVNVVEDKINRLETTFSNADALVRELKKELLPKIEEIKGKLEESIDRVKDKVDEKLAKEKEKVKDFVSQVENIDEDELKRILKEEELSSKEIEQQLDGLSGNNLPKIDTSMFEGRLQGHWMEKVLDLWIAKAYAVSNGASCFRRAPTYLIEDPSCLCRGNKSCAQTPFPKNLALKKSDKNLMSFSQMAFSVGSLVNQSSNAIMAGVPKRGLAGFERAQGLFGKLNRGSIGLIGNALKQNYNPTIISQSVKVALSTTKPALKDYYQRKGSIRVKPKSSLARIKNNSKDILGLSSQDLDFRASEKENDRESRMRESLRKKLMALKALGNPSVQKFKANPSGGYDYSGESINKDSSKSLFDVIKKRYLIIQSQGRL